MVKNSTVILSSGQQPTASLIAPLKESIIAQYSGTQIDDEPAVANECRMAIVFNLKDR